MEKPKIIIAERRMRELIGMPQEDCANYHNGIIAVADGVTRDCKDGRAATSDLLGLWNLCVNYPTVLNPAAIAAETFCNTAVMQNSDNVETIFEKSNEAVREINLRIGLDPRDIDYLVNDFGGCVAAVTVEREQDGQSVVNYGYISDCGVAIIDQKGNIKFKTEDKGPSTSQVIKDKVKFLGGWEHQEARKFVRQYLRNNPETEGSYGVVTGEDWSKIEPYLVTGQIERVPGDRLLVYSDGMEQIIQSGKFIDLLRKSDFQGLERLAKSKVKSEGTVVIH